MPVDELNEEWQMECEEAERKTTRYENKHIIKKYRKLKWWVVGHLKWHTGKYWNAFQINVMREYMDNNLLERKIVSAYEYWEKYSSANC